MKTLTQVVALAVLLVLTGCNTIAGAGKDIKAGGADLEQSADDAKK